MSNVNVKVDEGTVLLVALILERERGREVTPSEAIAAIKGAWMANKGADQ